jgi:hypothetical protein
MNTTIKKVSYLQYLSAIAAKPYIGKAWLILAASFDKRFYSFHKFLYKVQAASLCPM